MDIDLYAYLLLGLFFLILWILCYCLRKDLRPLMMKVSIAGAIVGPLSEIWYFRDYWSPLTIVGQGVISPEDVLFGFAVFGVAFAALPVVTGRRFTQSSPPSWWMLIVFLVSFFPAFFLLTDVGGINSIITASLVMLLWAVAVVILRREMLWHSLMSGVLLAGFSIVIYLALLNVATEYLSKYWFLWGTPLGLTVLGGVPLTEIIWYFCLGCCASVIAPYVEGKR